MRATLYHNCISLKLKYERHSYTGVGKTHIINHALKKILLVKFYFLINHFQSSIRFMTCTNCSSICFWLSGRENLISFEQNAWQQKHVCCHAFLICNAYSAHTSCNFSCKHIWRLKLCILCIHWKWHLIVCKSFSFIQAACHPQNKLIILQTKTRLNYRMQLPGRLV